MYFFGFFFVKTGNYSDQRTTEGRLYSHNKHTYERTDSDREDDLQVQYKFELELIARSLRDLRLCTILSNCEDRENGRR